MSLFPMPLFFIRHADWILSVFLVVLFVGWPEIDLAISRWFYDSEAGEWIWRHHPVNESIYAIFRYLPYWLVPLLLVMTIMSYRKLSVMRPQRKIWAFLLATLLIGPGVLVHNVFKEGFERPRPRQVQEFGGNSGFTPAWVVSDQCERKCKSFVSGHAAMGFYLMVFAWVFRRREWLWAGIGLGAVLSLVRISQGGHFLSDTVFAGVVCYFVYRGLSYWILGHSRIRES
ncbi:MAG: hypothetical protein CMI09_05165 [Oceanospirillaceae bacterium]|nr:hypothetical protein [Oceanospirillaceae bacterium]